MPRCLPSGQIRQEKYETLAGMNAEGEATFRLTLVTWLGHSPNDSGPSGCVQYGRCIGRREIRAVIGAVEMLRVDAAGGWQSVPRRSSHSCGAFRNQTPWAIHFRGGECLK